MWKVFDRELFKELLIYTVKLFYYIYDTRPFDSRFPTFTSRTAMFPSDFCPCSSISEINHNSDTNSLCAMGWICHLPYADIVASDQTARMRRLIWSYIDRMPYYLACKKLNMNSLTILLIVTNSSAFRTRAPPTGAKNARSFFQTKLRHWPLNYSDDLEI